MGKNSIQGKNGERGGEKKRDSSWLARERRLTFSSKCKRLYLNFAWNQPASWRLGIVCGGNFSSKIHFFKKTHCLQAPVLLPWLSGAGDEWRKTALEGSFLLERCLSPLDTKPILLTNPPGQLVSLFSSVNLSWDGDAKFSGQVLIVEKFFPASSDNCSYVFHSSVSEGAIHPVALRKTLLYLTLLKSHYVTVSEQLHSLCIFPYNLENLY